jgi:hypothetical protein
MVLPRGLTLLRPCEVRSAPSIEDASASRIRTSNLRVDAFGTLRAAPWRSRSRFARLAERHAELLHLGSKMVRHAGAAPAPAVWNA